MTRTCPTSKLGELVDGQYRIVSQPPVIVPARDLAATYGLSPDDVMPSMHEQFRAYRATLPHDRRRLLEKFQIIDAARKVVGVGSVGTRSFYWRQLRDMKGSALVDSMAPVTLTYYARLCGWTLARAHARSGDSVAITEYLGSSDAFDRSITGFSERYADQNEQDYEQFVKAIRTGRLEAVEGV